MSLAKKQKMIRETMGLPEKVVKLENELFEAREIITGVKALDRTADLFEKVKIFNALIRERLGATQSVFFLYWSGDEVFRLAEATGLHDEFKLGKEFSQREGSFWELICQGEVFVGHGPEGTGRFGELFQQTGLDRTGLELFVPLAISGEPIGVAAFCVADAGDWLEEVYLARFAAQASASIKNAMLYEINQRDKAILDQTLNNLKMLYNVGRMMIHISELKDLLKFILNEACKTTGAQKGSLMLLDDYTHRLVVRVVQGLPDRVVEKKINDGEMECTSFASGEGIAGRVFAEKKPIIVNDVSKHDDFSNREASNVQSILCIPLIVDEEPIGVINITNKKSGEPFSEEDQQFLLAMGSQAAMGIHRAQLYDLAIKDELTGLFIRRYFTHRLQEEIRRARRYKQEFSLIMLDIDHFKDVNDTYGHAVGDKALICMAKLLEKTVRDPDVPCRYGGEEFVVMLPETGIDGAALLAERLRVVIEETIIPELKRAITVSLGVATYPIHGDEATTLMHAADMALYSAKEEGRNRVHIWHENSRPTSDSTD